MSSFMPFLPSILARTFRKAAFLPVLILAGLSGNAPAAQAAIYTFSYVTGPMETDKLSAWYRDYHYREPEEFPEEFDAYVPPEPMQLSFSFTFDTELLGFPIEGAVASMSGDAFYGFTHRVRNGSSSVEFMCQNFGVIAKERCWSPGTDRGLGVGGAFGSPYSGRSEYSIGIAADGSVASYFFWGVDGLGDTEFTVSSSGASFHDRTYSEVSYFSYGPGTWTSSRSPAPQIAITPLPAPALLLIGGVAALAVAGGRARRRA